MIILKLQNEVAVKVDGKCCPECRGNWITAVNPKVEGKFGSEVKLTCKIVKNAEVTVKNVNWLV